MKEIPMLPTRARIMEAVCRAYEVSQEDIGGLPHNVTKIATEARHVYAWFCRALRNDVYSVIQKDIGLRTHGPVIYGIQEMIERYRTNAGCATRERVEAALKELGYEPAAVIVL